MKKIHLFENSARGTIFSLRLLLFSTLAVLFLQYGCKNSPLEWLLRNPREYIWTVDTLYLPLYAIQVQSVWGSTNDLYAVGNSGGSAGTMWHFNGNSWTNVKLGSFEGGTIPPPYELYAIHGLSADNIFAVGQRCGPTKYWTSFIIHYDGKQWREQQTPGGNFLFSVWANAPNDVWACGINGTLFHYDGIQWKKDSVAVATPPGSTFYLGSIARIPTDEMFMLGAAYEARAPQIGERWTYYFFRRESDQWKLIDTFVRESGEQEGKWGGNGRLIVLPSGTMYSVDSYGVFQWIGTRWIKRYDNINGTTSVFGTADDNLFVTGVHGLLVHYNGVDWFQYRNLEWNNVHYISGWTDGNQAFVFGWVEGKTIVLRGR